MDHVKSKSIRACQQRIRLCKKEVGTQLFAGGNGVNGTSASQAPTGGIGKHSPSKVKNTPKKATKTKKTTAAKDKTEADISEKEDTPMKDEVTD
jgi:hypothetical protein